MRVKAKMEPKGIVSWPEDERPRERLLSRGPNALTDAELLAILVRVGFEGTNAVELGRRLLKQFGSLRAMAEAPVAALMDIKGLKGAKVAQLSAAMEIARRVSLPDKRNGTYIKGTAQAATYLKERLRGLAEENFRAGKPIGAMDMLIGAHALALGVTLVTNNVKEFKQIKSLKIVDWSM